MLGEGESALTRFKKRGIKLRKNSQIGEDDARLHRVGVQDQDPEHTWEILTTDSMELWAYGSATGNCIQAWPSSAMKGDAPSQM